MYIILLLIRVKRLTHLSAENLIKKYGIGEVLLSIVMRYILDLVLMSVQKQDVLLFSKHELRIIINVRLKVYIHIVMNEKLETSQDEISQVHLGAVSFERIVSIVQQVVVLERIMLIRILCVQVRKIQMLTQYLYLMVKHLLFLLMRLG